MKNIIINNEKKYTQTNRILPNELIKIITSYLTSKDIIVIKYPLLVENIISYMPIHTTMMLSNKYYLRAKPHIHISDRNIDKFLINIVKENLHITLKTYIIEKKITTKQLFRNKKLHYQKKGFSNLFSLLNYICIEYKSTKCRNILKEIEHNDSEKVK